MFRYAIIFLILSLIAGGIGLTNISVWLKRISLVFFALFFLGFLALLGFAYLLGEAFEAGARPGMIIPLPIVAGFPVRKLVRQIA
jgi:uncharacterized membrane protein YtjA (UPF0391 family)